MNIGVHITHCCIKHGCKYNDPGCPIVLGLVKQEYQCEDCYNIENGNWYFSYEDMRKAFNHERIVNDFVVDDETFEDWIKREFTFQK